MELILGSQWLAISAESLRNIVGSTIFFRLFLNVLGVQMSCFKYLKVSRDLTEHIKGCTNTFRQYRDDIEKLSCKGMRLMAYKVSKS